MSVFTIHFVLWITDFVVCSDFLFQSQPNFSENWVEVKACLAACRELRCMASTCDDVLPSMAGSPSVKTLGRMIFLPYTSWFGIPMMIVHSIVHHACLAQ